MTRADDADTAALTRELMREQLRFFRHQNARAEREDFERHLWESLEALERKGYEVLPRRRGRR